MLLKKLSHLKSAVRFYSQSQVESVRLAYASYESTASGEGPPPLVVMHGLFGSKANWNSICKALHKNTKPQRKIIAVDARNHGDSPHTTEHTYKHLAEDLKGLCDSFKIKKATFMGHSMGGRAVMYLALKYPDLIEKLIVVDISPVQTSPGLQAMPALFNVMLNIELPKNVPMSMARQDVEKQLAVVVNDKPLRAFLLTNLVQGSDGVYKWRINISSLVANFGNIARFPDNSNRGTSFSGPVLFIAGENSDYLPKTDHEKIRELFPSSQFDYIAGAGHWVQSEKPNDFLKLALDFVNKDPGDLFKV